ncbi:uncharacterized protein LOC107621482 [Arachis ipaensis]|uniref:uncharacterized protein LOC107621482 n=1 Tax=Arachis ipaensis TaxID=130454 RepID=UPI0007AEF04B|nr:uncharacterized protein LOC107621482 [Arachis ipaensis]
MAEELQAMENNHTWKVVPLPIEKHCISCRWVYKVKHKQDGSVDRCKARLVARGNTQQAGVDYKDTFSSVAKLTTLDINNAFLNVDLDEEVLRGNGLLSSPLLCLVLVSLSPNKIILYFIEEQVLGPLKYFLRLEIVKSKEGICLSQRNYTLSLLEDTGFSDCKPTSVPLDPNIKFTATDGDLLEDAGQYKRLIGRLLYLTISRPDICFAVNKLSQYMSSPCTTHLDAVYHVLRYLKAAPGQGLLLSISSPLSVKAYGDVDWGSCAETRRSTTDYYVFLSDSLISWKSKKKDTVSRSTTEAEYQALANITAEVVWIMRLF